VQVSERIEVSLKKWVGEILTRLFLCGAPKRALDTFESKGQLEELTPIHALFCVFQTRLEQKSFSTVVVLSSELADRSTCGSGSLDCG